MENFYNYQNIQHLLHIWLTEDQIPKAVEALHLRFEIVLSANK